MRHGAAEVLNHLPIYVLGRVHVHARHPQPHLTPAPPQMPQPSARCSLRQLAAPWVSAGQKLAAAHTRHTGCSHSPQQRIILKTGTYLPGSKDTAYVICGLYSNPHTYGLLSQAGHMHIQAHCFPGREERADSLLDSSFSLTHT